MSRHKVSCGQCSWVNEGNENVRYALASHDKHYRDVHMGPAVNDLIEYVEASNILRPRTVLLTPAGEVLMKSTQLASDGVRALWWRCGCGHNMTTLEAEHLPASILHVPEVAA